MSVIKLKDMQAVLDAHNVGEELRQALIAAAKPTRKKTKVLDDWGRALQALQRDRRSIATNMHNRSAQLRPIYEEYIGIMDKVRTMMEQAQVHGPLADATRQAALVNAERAVNGQPPIGACTEHWQTWVPPAKREAFAVKVVQSYASSNTHRGPQFTPFISPGVRASTKRTEQLLRKTFARLREANETQPKSQRGHTPYRALLLCAARMAEQQLNQRVRAYGLGTANPVEHPLPINWLALLDGKLRQRLREAQKAPGMVTLDGLQDFYEPAPENVRETYEDVDALHARENPDAFDDATE